MAQYGHNAYGPLRRDDAEAGVRHVPAMIVTVNVGSSSMRLAAYRADGTCAAQQKHAPAPGGDEAPALLAEFAAACAAAPLAAVAHRIVHGGAVFHRPCLVDEQVERALAALAPLAPLHNPPALAWVRAARAAFGAAVAQVAVFDTAFFTDLPERAARYALPEELCARHAIRRYGFHGIAHHAMWQAYRRLAPRGGARLISLQLGAGCSIAAIHDGRAIDTSMGFSPLEGLVMATRCGDLDPGVVTYLQRAAGWDAAEIDALLNHRAGLLGLSGTSADMDALLASDAPRARLAVEIFCYRARKYIGAYAAALGGVDAVAFGGGIGEHAPRVRAQILDGLAWCGIALDADANRKTTAGEARISAPESAAAVWVIPVDEAGLIAAAARALLNKGDGGIKY